MAVTLLNVVSRAQAALGDVSGDYWTKTTLLPHINSAYHDVGRAYRVNSVKLTRGRTVVNSFTAGLVLLDRASTPALPADFLEPVELWEKDVGALDTSYVLLEQAEDQLPDVEQGPYLRVWDWYSNGIRFVGATTARTLRIDYQRGFTDLSADGDVLSVDDCLEPVALLGAAYAAGSQDQARGAADLRAQGYAALHDLITTEVKVMQRTPRRRLVENTSPAVT